MLTIAVMMQLADSGLIVGEGGHSIIVLLSLLTAMLFFDLGGRVKMPVMQSYLVIGLALLAAMEGISLILHPFSLATLTNEAHIGLFFVVFSAGICALSYGLTKQVQDSGPASGDYRNIYARSLRVTAVILAMTACLLQGMQSIVLASAIIRPLDVLVPALAAGTLLSANVRLRFPGVDLIAFLLGILVLIAFDYLALHSGRPFDWRPGGGSPDQWLLSGLISLLLAIVSSRLQARRLAENYLAPLNTAAAALYAWVMLAAIVSFGNDPFGHGGFHFGMSLILIAGQFLLLREAQHAAFIRGVSVPLLLLAGLCALLALLQRTDLLRFAAAACAFGLLFCARRLLPGINARWPVWAIYPAYPEWIGWILVFASLLSGGPEWAQEWPWLLVVVIYQLLLRKSWLDLPTLLMGGLVGSWAASAGLHPGAGFSVWPGAQRFPDIWFLLALVSLAYAVLSRVVCKFSTLECIYRDSLQTAGVFCWIWAFFGMLPLLVDLGFAGSMIFPWLALTLLLAIFPLSQAFPSGARIRDIASSTLFALMLLCLWTRNPGAPPHWIGLLALALLLWTIASFIIPAFSRLLPLWAFEAVCWPWLGLLAVLAAFPPTPLSASSLCVYFLSLSLYGVLMLRYSRLRVFVWLPGAGLTAAGIAAAIVLSRLRWGFYQASAVADTGAPFALTWLPLAFTFNMLLWANIQLLLVRAGRRKGAILARTLQLLRQDLAETFERGACWIMAGGLLLYALRILDGFRHFFVAPSMPLAPYTLLVGVLLILSFWHGLRSRFGSFLLHCLTFSLFLTLGGCYLGYFTGLILPPMLLALWCLLLAVFESICSRDQGTNRPMIENVLAVWLRFSLIFATLSLLIYPFRSLGDVLSTLLLITVITGFQGVWMLRASWFYIACAELLAVLHLWPFLWFEADDARALLPWYALQLYLLTRLLSFISSRLEGTPAGHNDRLAMCRVVFSFGPWLNALAFLELFAHGAAVFFSLQQGMPVRWLSPFWDPAAALGAGLVQFAIGVRAARKSPDAGGMYGLVLLVAGLGFYVRLVAFGLTPVSLWDTSMLIVFAYGQFFIQRLFPSKSLLRMAMLTPLAALMTVPLQLQSAEASMTLMVTGLLYLLIRRYTRKQLPMYLALLAFNIGLYLWIPGIVEQNHLIQIYVIPAALTLLILVQLHRRELKPSVMMATRLAATSSIYACATLDVFLLPDLKVFVLALGLSLIGIILGIALRIRAFMYAGVAFMLLNVFGQLIRFYPEQALGKAIVLMGAGMVILSTMIWFNLKKMQILQRIDLIRDELESWE
ncbi:MAG: hypothetical protein ACU83P_10290, partial [Gammaproteobacteria bacterium]